MTRVQLAGLSLSFLVACTTARSVPTPGALERPGSRPAPAAKLALYLRCPTVYSKGAKRSLLHPPPLMVELKNEGMVEASTDEIVSFNLDLPDRVAHSSDANASFTLVRIGAPKGRQSYSCDETTPRPPPKQSLKPGASYRAAVDASLALEEGEYRAETTYYGLKAECRFRIVP